MRVRFLGTAAGGGLPQWNCGCPGCVHAREAGTGRLQDCVAVSGDDTHWYLLNASPDVGRQLAAAPELAPAPGSRDTPVRGVLLCTAELDHTIGLLSLREAGRLNVYATGAVLAALSGPFPVRWLLGSYTEVAWHPVEPGMPIELDGGLRAEPLHLGTKRPRYVAGLSKMDWIDWVVAYRLTDLRTGGVVVYAPCLARWRPELAAGADHVILDGTFLHADELGTAKQGTDKTGTDKTGAGQAAMGHLPIAESLPGLPRGPRYHYTHLNNTNPVADPGAPERGMFDGTAATVAEDGQVIEI